MNNPFGFNGFEKGMELLEHGLNTAKQQVKTTQQTATSQITGQQPTLQQQNHQPQPKLDSFKEQVMGNPTPTPHLDTVKAQLMGAADQPKPQPAPVDAQAAIQKAQNDKFTSDLYGVSDNPQDLQKMQQTLDPNNLAAQTQADQAKQAELRKHLNNYYRPEFEQKPQQLRQQKQEEEKQEQQVEEQHKMEELKIEEKKKDEDMMVKRAQNKMEIKVGAG